ncbi:MAG: DUF2271 domain-containing protein [Maritimibacter sp.]
MKSLLTALLLTTAITLPTASSAKQVTLTAQMKGYYGNPAYLAFYVTDANGQYKGSLWMAGGRSKYYRHLRGWMRGSRGNLGDINGITGASVGSGRSLSVTLNLSDALFDAGYVLHIDAAAENMTESQDDVRVPLTTSGAGKAVAGRSYIASFSYK